MTDTIDRSQALALIDSSETFESDGLTLCVATLKNGWTVIGTEFSSGDGAREAAYEDLMLRLINQGQFLGRQVRPPVSVDRKKVAARLMAAQAAGVIKARVIEQPVTPVDEVPALLTKVAR